MTVPEAEFGTIANRLLAEPGVDEGTGFGTSPGLRVAGKIFAMVVRGRLVVKLPAERCTELVSAGLAEPFDRGQGRPLKQWIMVGESSTNKWPTLAREALAFVGSEGRR